MLAAGPLVQLCFVKEGAPVWLGCRAGAKAAEGFVITAITRQLVNAKMVRLPEGVDKAPPLPVFAMEPASAGYRTSFRRSLNRYMTVIVSGHSRQTTKHAARLWVCRNATLFI